MTKREYSKCEELMNYAIDGVKMYKTIEIDGRLSEITLENPKSRARVVGKYYGEAMGIKHVLDAIGFKHEKMKELSELL